MTTMEANDALDEACEAISAAYLAWGNEAFEPEAWERYRFGLPLALMAAEGQIHIARGSEAEGFVNEVYEWLKPVLDTLDESAV